MKRLLIIGLILVLILCLGAAGVGGYLWYVWSSNLPYIGSLKEYNPPIITEIYSDDGQIIGKFWDEKRIVIPLEKVPKHVIHAFVAAEDARFYEHEGVDLQSIIRAFIKNIRAGRIEQGGSTITQQVTRSLLLKNPRKTYKRKAREALLSLQIEKAFSKEKILFLYLNQIYLGHGAYGVEAAARTYFDKGTSELTLAEAALLAGLPQAPSRYSAINHFERAKNRQKYVLERMREEGFITRQQEIAALQATLDISKDQESFFQKAPYFTEYVRQYLENQYGRDMLYRGGLKAYTTVHLGMQETARVALEKGLRDLDKREGYRGPLRHLEPEEWEAFRLKAATGIASEPPEIGDIVEGLVIQVDDQKRVVAVDIGGVTGLIAGKDMKWARKPNPKVPYYAGTIKYPGQALKAGDVVLVRVLKTREDPGTWSFDLEQEPDIQGALLCLETETGRVKTMVGGKDFSESQFNRAVQSRRQPGSAFKPIIYAAALDKGMTPSTVIIDAPYISTMNPKDKDLLWRPKNYKEKFYGPTLLRTGLIKSRNVITVKILKAIGVPYAIQYARQMGIESELNPDLSLALGASGLSLLELTRAYTVFSNGGMLVRPIFINKIEDRNGRLIEENQPSLEECLSRETAYVMTDLMEGVIREGTGWRIRALKRPAGGKTGTTNDLKDAWFLGFTPSLATGVWVGYDDHHSMGKGETGSRAASPIWLHFMSEVLKAAPVKDFRVPEGVVFAKIDAHKGLLASAYSKKSVFQAFKEGTEPTTYTEKPRTAKSGQFSQFDMEFGQ
jgi:penicillin-binding protein 1A